MGAPARHVDFYDVKMDVEALFGARGDRLRFEAAAHPALHPGRSARVSLDGKVVGWIGELHPRWAQQADLAHAPVVFELDVAALSEGELPQVREQSRQPIVVRDLALWVDAQVPVQSMLDTVTALAKTDFGWPCCAICACSTCGARSPRMACPRPRKALLSDSGYRTLRSRWTTPGWRTAWRASGCPDQRTRCATPRLNMGNTMLAEPRTLTKAELAELLFERVGLNSARPRTSSTPSSKRSATLARGDLGEALGIRQSQVRDSRRALAAIPRRARPSPSPRAAW